MSDLAAIQCFCGQAMSCEDNGKAFVFRHKIEDKSEELSVPYPVMERLLTFTITEWLVAIHDLQPERAGGEEVRAPRVSYRFPDSS